jgi:hypothetical protein
MLIRKITFIDAERKITQLQKNGKKNLYVQYVNYCTIANVKVVQR